MKRTKPCVFALFILIVAAMLFSAAVFTFDGEENRKLCSAASVYDMLNPRIIEIYETEIAGESVVSDMSAATLSRTADRLGISVEKLKAVLMLQDLAARVGRSVSLNELAAMNDLKLFTFFKQCAEDYLSTQPEGRRQELEKLLKDALKG